MQFKNLSDLQKYLEHNVAEVLERTAEVEQVLVDAMVEAVEKVVYDAYSPEEYERRGTNDGLADPRNMMITGVNFFSGGKVHVTFENLAHGNDTLQGEFLTDMIVEGNKDDWMNPNGPWSEPRDFVSATAEAIRNNPEELSEAIKKGLIAKGYKVQ